MKKVVHLVIELNPTTVVEDFEKMGEEILHGYAVQGDRANAIGELHLEHGCRAYDFQIEELETTSLFDAHKKWAKSYFDME